MYGRTAILLQFRWGDSTEDVDVVIRTVERASAVEDAAAFAALQVGLPGDWLNNYVGAFTAEKESESFFSAFGAYPRGETPGLRVFLAKPEYICAMKLKALQRESIGDRDFEDAVRLAAELGIETTDRRRDLFASYFPGERLDRAAAARLPEVAEAVRSRRHPGAGRRISARSPPRRSPEANPSASPSTNSSMPSTSTIPTRRASNGA